ncbi:MAG: tetratricopeptide repeat protein [Bdellovibrionales bacterium]|nr:tetratricopeptide repeat protein [Bdellovibrionales bacterium]
MKRSQIFICALPVVLISVLFTGCKTQEDIRREKTVENLNEEIQQTKKNTASGNSRFMAIEEQVSRLSGQIEEMSHASSQTAKENQQFQSRLTNLEETNKKQVEYIKELTEKVNNQSGYIEEVIASLAKLSEKPAETSKSGKKKVDPDSVDLAEDEAPTFENGMKKYRAKDFDSAKVIFVEVSENKKASKKNREGAIHHLGMIEYKNKNYEGAKVYFSKVFSENQSSSFAPAALLNLGKSFIQLKSKDEANMTFDELMSRFPKSKEAAEASKLKK